MCGYEMQWVNIFDLCDFYMFVWYVTPQLPTSVPKLRCDSARALYPKGQGVGAST